MEMSIRQQKFYEFGQQVRLMYGDISFSYALEKLLWGGEYPEIMEEICEERIDRQFFEAGFLDYAPQWRQAYRYGEIPAKGYSVNWSTKDAEKGVSCVRLIGGKHDNDSSIYDVIYGLQGIKKIKIEGWYLGQYGSDGEPLLICAREVA